MIGAGKSILLMNEFSSTNRAVDTFLLSSDCLIGADWAAVITFSLFKPSFLGSMLKPARKARGLVSSPGRPSPTRFTSNWSSFGRGGRSICRESGSLTAPLVVSPRVTKPGKHFFIQLPRSRNPYFSGIASAWGLVTPDHVQIHQVP